MQLVFFRTPSSGKDIFSLVRYTWLRETALLLAHIVCTHVRNKLSPKWTITTCRGENCRGGNRSYRVVRRWLLQLTAVWIIKPSRSGVSDRWVLWSWARCQFQVRCTSRRLPINRPIFQAKNRRASWRWCRRLAPPRSTNPLPFLPVPDM